MVSLESESRNNSKNKAASSSTTTVAHEQVLKLRDLNAKKAAIFERALYDFTLLAEAV